MLTSSYYPKINPNVKYYKSMCNKGSKKNV